MALVFGDRVAGLTVAGKELQAGVFDEHAVRAAAGVTLVLGATAFSFAQFDAQFLLLQVVSSLFFVEFLVRITAGIRYSPAGALAHRAWPTTAE